MFAGTLGGLGEAILGLVYGVLLLFGVVGTLTIILGADDDEEREVGLVVTDGPTRLLTAEDDDGNDAVLVGADNCW